MGYLSLPSSQCLLLSQLSPRPQSRCERFRCVVLQKRRQHPIGRGSVPGVVSQAPMASDAVDQNSAAMRGVFAALRTVWAIP
jgi:hypothetical protein